MTVVIAPGTNRHFSYTVTAAVTADRIWVQWMEVAAWPTWDTELRSASADAPLASGVRGRVVPSRGRPSEFRVTEFVDLLRYAFVTRLPLASLTVTRSLHVHDDSTLFTHDVRFDGLLGRLFAAAFGPAFRRALPKVMMTLAARAADSTVRVPRQP
jgi:Polyketide cyclase / dehydrase and lipid transport